jgi:hypothetical protein
MPMRLLLTFAIGALVVLYLLVMEAIDTAGRVEYIRDHFPKLLKWVEHRAWYRILLLVTAAMIAGGLWEIIQEPTPQLIVKAPPAPIMPQPVPIFSPERPEPQDSLRRRTEKAADELYEYLEKRAANQPPFAGPNSNDPNPSDETKKAIQRYQAYAQETENYYMRHFKDRMVGIIREYQLKGVPVRYLENDFSRTQLLPYIAAVGSVGEGADDLSQFRELAFHVDARDNLITF